MSSKAEERSPGDIRALADGAGPSHIFWLNGPQAGKLGADIVGVIDPLFSVIRLFAIDRAKDALSELNGRVHALGVCSFPVSFSPWHVHAFRDLVVIEGMPRPDRGGQNAIARSFRSDLLRIERELTTSDRAFHFRAAAEQLEKAGWDPSSAPACGRLSPSAQPTGAATSYAARRSTVSPWRTIILSNKTNALAPGYPLTVSMKGSSKYYLYSAQELEPAGTIRIVQTSQGVLSNDGMVRIAQRLLIFGKNEATSRRELEFDESFARTKLGYKPLAILPSGEVLAMGRFGADARFAIRSCGNILSVPAGVSEICRSIGGEVAAGNDFFETPAEPAPPGDSGVKGSIRPASRASVMFARVRPYIERSWSVNTDELPEQCRKSAGCAVPGQVANFVPLKGIRLSRGNFTRIGAPYAQTEDLRDVRKFLSTSDANLTSALARVLDGGRGAPGNLNDDYDGDVGIDCSALVQIAWIGADTQGRLSTSVLQTQKHIPYRCDNRVGNAAALRPGDALGLSLSGRLNHVALYAGELAFDGANTSWLVLESSSSCDGVCWSLYDPGYFNGWGIYRAAGRKDFACPKPTKATSIEYSPIPEVAGAWRAMLNKSFGDRP